jgi:CRP-like cAMP-binding protein
MLLNLPRPEVFRFPCADRQLEELYQHKNFLNYQKGKEIPLFQKDVLLVQQGIVRISTLDDEGDSILLALASSSMPFGLPLTSVEPYIATALTNVSLLRFTAAEIDQYFDLNRLILRGLDQRLQQSEAIQSILGGRHIQERLYRFLLLLGKEIGEPVAGGMRITARLTHQQLASTIGTTRVTVTRVLGKLQGSGKIKFDNNRHMVVAAPQNNILHPVKSPVAMAN